MNPEYPETEGCYFPRLERTMRDIPEKYHEFLWEYTGQGNSPHVVQAAVCYIESESGLSECSDYFDTNENAISQAVNGMIKQNVVTLAEVRENNHKNGFQKFGENRNSGKNQHS